MATLGVSHERTILCGSNLADSLNKLKLWDDAKTLVRDQLSVARQSLGTDHNLTLRLNQRLATALMNNPERTRDDPRFQPTPIRAAARSQFCI